ncbi:MAG: hypothetical protein OEY64_03040 [Nitrospinota bacterium]|nr:hypothetical protein [Nitrospinota bacterium]
MNTPMTFNVLFEKDGNAWVGHCLELDIVSSREDFESSMEEMGDLISTAVSYAFANDNLENLYHPAPPEMWEKFYKCKGPKVDSRKVLVGHNFTDPNQGRFVPPEITANACCVG